MIAALAGVAIVIVFVLRNQKPPPPNPPSASFGTAESPKASRNSNAVNYAGFEKRPFAVTRESGLHQWTDADGKDSANIRKLAHNELEYDRMLAENATIYRRQLVYRKQTMTD
ncbi:MAG TPA: hypothetical protein VK327_13755, partial [Candidatus Paceibacterota bacterium]|nr:hypothetical protein [Candidatus Paceibacterota bacterium]